jgi:hypothetical protein
MRFLLAFLRIADIARRNPFSMDWSVRMEFDRS